MPLNIRLMLSCLLAACSSLASSPATTAHSSESDVRQTRTSIETSVTPRLETEMSAAPLVEERRPRVVKPLPLPELTAASLHLNNKIDQNLLEAIQSHLGASYHF